MIEDNRPGWYPRSGTSLKVTLLGTPRTIAGNEVKCMVGWRLPIRSVESLLEQLSERASFQARCHGGTQGVHLPWISELPFSTRHIGCRDRFDDELRDRAGLTSECTPMHAIEVLYARALEAAATPYIFGLELPHERGYYHARTNGRYCECYNCDPIFRPLAEGRVSIRKLAEHMCNTTAPSCVALVMPDSIICIVFYDDGVVYYRALEFRFSGNKTLDIASMIVYVENWMDEAGSCWRGPFDMFRSLLIDAFDSESPPVAVQLLDIQAMHEAVIDEDQHEKLWEGECFPEALTADIRLRVQASILKLRAELEYPRVRLLWLSLVQPPSSSRRQSRRLALLQTSAFSCLSTDIVARIVTFLLPNKEKEEADFDDEPVIGSKWGREFDDGYDAEFGIYHDDEDEDEGSEDEDY